MELHEKILAVLREDDTGKGPISLSNNQPNCRLSEFERDLIDWGVVYGMTFGIARGEADQFETTETVAARALPSAWEAYQWYGGDFEYPRPDLALAELRKAHDRAAVARVECPEDLADAIVGVLNGVASHEPEGGDVTGESVLHEILATLDARVPEVPDDDPYRERLDGLRETWRAAIGEATR